MTDVLGLEQRGLNAWPAPHSVAYGGWVFRGGGGYTKRANSANALRPASDFSDVRREAERFYAARGQPTIFRLSPLAGAEVDSRLEAAGYEKLDPSGVMTATLAPEGVQNSVTLAPSPTPEWLDGIAAAQDVAPPQRTMHDAIVQAIAAPAAFATVFVGDVAAGFGLGVGERDAVGLFDIVIDPAFRGRGLGRAITRSLMRWGREGGASSAYLQVSDDNLAARSLYEGLGFRDAYPYHYRRGAP